MRMRMPFLTGVLCLAYATPAFACDFYFNSTFLRIPARPAFGGGMQTAFGDATIWSFAGDVAMRLGDKAVVQPGVGFCTGGDNTDWFFGAGGAYRLMQSASMTINFQTGLTYASISGGSQLRIPIGGTILMRQNGILAKLRYVLVARPVSGRRDAGQRSQRSELAASGLRRSLIVLHSALSHCRVALERQAWAT